MNITTKFNVWDTVYFYDEFLAMKSAKKCKVVEIIIDHKSISYRCTFAYDGKDFSRIYPEEYLYFENEIKEAKLKAIKDRISTLESELSELRREEQLLCQQDDSDASN